MQGFVKTGGVSPSRGCDCCDADGIPLALYESSEAGYWFCDVCVESGLHAILTDGAWDPRVNKAMGWIANKILKRLGEIEAKLETLAKEK